MASVDSASGQHFRNVSETALPSVPPMIQILLDRSHVKLHRADERPETAENVVSFQNKTLWILFRF